MNMHIRYNQSAVEAIQRASLSDVSTSQMKPLYIQQNTFDIDLDEPIFRVLAERYLLDDISRGRLTHSRISKTLWSDKYENPLLGVEFDDPSGSGKLTLDGIVENMFGVCWTDDAAESMVAWNNFSHGQPSVRIKSTPRKILTAAMNTANPYFMLYHHIGRVMYSNEDQIIASLGKNFDAHLDSLGHGGVLSLMNLRTALAAEREVRLVYSHMPDESWVHKNVELCGNYCKIPFDWNSVVDEVVVGPLVANGGEAVLRTALHNLCIDCPIFSSKFRIHIG
jgi:hypothetical protein